MKSNNSVHGFSLDLSKTEIRGLTLYRHWVLLLKGGKCRERPTYLYGKHGKAFLMTHLVSTILWETFLTPIVCKQLIYTSDGQQVSKYFLVTLQFLRCELSTQTHGALSLIPNDTMRRERKQEAGGMSSHTSIHWIYCNEPALPLLQI